MTVKEYAAANHVSEQSVYAKINRNSEKLKGHILRQNGRTHLDKTAQEILKPTEGNYQLAKKADSLEKSLDEKREYGDYMESKCKNLQEQLSERDRRIASLEQELSNEKVKTAEMAKTITELTGISNNVAELTERLDIIFTVLEETANTGMGKKIGNLLSGKH